MEEDGGGNTR